MNIDTGHVATSEEYDQAVAVEKALYTMLPAHMAVASLQNRANSMEDAIGRFETALASVQSRADTLKASLDRVEAKLDSLGMEVSGQWRWIGTLTMVAVAGVLVLVGSILIQWLTEI